jgi:hypothetical protein
MQETLPKPSRDAAPKSRRAPRGGHLYVVPSLDRNRLVARLAVAAVPAAAGLSALAKQVTGGPVNVIGSSSALLLFAAAFLVFDRWLWHRRMLSTVPNLAGSWHGSLTIRAPGQPIDAHVSLPCTVKIEQTWSRIAVTLTTDRNQSRSTSAVLDIDAQSLEFSYRVDWRDASQSDHIGYQRLIAVQGDWDTLRGPWFTDRQFQHFGELEITRT